MEEPVKMEYSSTHVPVLTATQELIVKQVSIQTNLSVTFDICKINTSQMHWVNKNML